VTGAPLSAQADAQPEGWQRRRLGELLREVDVRAGVSGIEAELEVLSLTKNHGLIPQLQRFGKRIATEDVRKYKVVREGQIVYNPYVIWEGAVHRLNGRGAGLVSPVYPVWEAVEGDSRFIDYLLRTPELIGAYNQLCSGAVNRRRSIKEAAFVGIEVLIPPVTEQRAIAGVLRTVERARKACEQVIEATRQLKQSLLRHLFAYGAVPFDQADRVPVKETEIGPLPHAWDASRLGQVAQLLSGGTPSKRNPEFWRGQIPWATPKDMKSSRLRDTEDHISESGLQAGSRQVPTGSLFIVVRGMILARDIPVAMAAVPMAFNQDMKAVVPGTHVLPDFLLYALGLFKRALRRQIGTSAHGTRRISSSAVENLIIPVPPMAEQAHIAASLAAVDAKLLAEESRHKAVDGLYQSLLHHLMTGNLRVNHVVDQLVPDGTA
jgi:type I restriction enzyme S subunit